MKLTDLCVSRTIDELRDSPAAVHRTSVLTQHVFFSHSQSVCLCLPLFPYFTVKKQREEFSMHLSNCICPLFFFLPLFIFHSFPFFSQNLSGLVLSLADLSVSVGQTKHGEQHGVDAMRV